MNSGASRCAWFWIVVLLFGCANSTPAPRVTPAPTRAEPVAVAQRALAEVLSELEHNLDQTRMFLKAFATSASVQSQDAPECTINARTLLDVSPMYAQLAAANERSILFCTTLDYSLQASVLTHLEVQRALYTNDFAMGKLLLNTRETPEPALAFAYPIHDRDGHSQGVVMATLRIRWLAEQFARVNIPTTSEIVLIDREGTVVLRGPDSDEWAGKNISDTTLGYILLRHHQGSGAYVGLDGVRRMYAFASPERDAAGLTVAVGIKE